MCFNAQKKCQLFIKIADRKLHMSNSEVPASARPHLVDYRLRAAMLFMQKNLSNPCMAEEVASLVGMSRSRFFELFHDQLGTSPHVHWNAIRIEEASNRLRTSAENITSIAMDLGFSNPGNFSRFFRDHVGVTPSSYRRISHAA